MWSQSVEADNRAGDGRPAGDTIVVRPTPDGRTQVPAVPGIATRRLGPKNGKGDEA